MPSIKDVVRAVIRQRRPVTFGDLTRTEPVEHDYGALRGQVISRYYVDKFMDHSRKYITGDTMEVADTVYSSEFGHSLGRQQVLHVDPNHPGATHIMDLTEPDTVPESVADCFICTQTFNVIFNFMDAIRSSRKLLKPGGALVSTIQALGPVSRHDDERWGDYFRFMPGGALRAMSEVFGEDNVQMQVYGNALSASFQMQGIVVEDLPDVSVLDVIDREFPVTIGIIAVRDN
jgi:hypothetical protein